MAEFRSELVNRLVERGFVHQCTDLEALDALAADGPITGYIGFDCTADSLHVGHQVSLMMLRTLQRTYLEACRPMDLAVWRTRSKVRQVAENVGRLLSPLL